MAKTSRSSPKSAFNHKKTLSKTVVPVLLPIEPPHVAPRRNLEVDKRALEAVVKPEEALELASVTPDELSQVLSAKPTHLTTVEKLAILEMHQRNYPVGIIAARLARATVTINRFLNDYKPTTLVAKAYLEANAEKIAARVVKHADVDQSMEVLDRLDVLNKKQKESGGAQTQFNVIVGGPGAVSIPVPKQSDIEMVQKG